MSLLEVHDLTKRFGQLAVVQQVDLRVEAGERHAVIGSNGAGKSSLFHMITGRLRPTSGRIRFCDREIAGLAPHRIARMGLARSFQITNIFPRLSVLENVRLSVQARPLCHRERPAVRSGLAETRSRAMGVLESLHLSAVAHSLAGTLSYGDQRRLEIGLALALDPILILLDEPTAGMSLAASREIVDLLHGIPRSVTMLLIEHDIDAALKLSDRVTVMHQGQVLAQGTPAEIQHDSRVQDVYFGGRTDLAAGDPS
jgi:branched-chain amino acid transport system ATP-binding protein